MHAVYHFLVIQCLLKHATDAYGVFMHAYTHGGHNHSQNAQKKYLSMNKYFFSQKVSHGKKSVIRVSGAKKEGGRLLGVGP